MRWRQLMAAGALVGILAPLPSYAGPNDGVERALHAASVLVGAGCSGVLAEGPDLVLTAEHCIAGRQSLELRFSDGSTRTGWVVAIDHAADQALLLLEEPVALTPLMVARGLPIGGTVLYFEGRPSV